MDKYKTDNDAAKEKIEARNSLENYFYLQELLPTHDTVPDHGGSS